MTKPTEKTDWATSGEALRLPTTSDRWDFGWKTLPSNLPSEIGEKPNLQEQNYWQFAVHTWISYFDSIVPDNVGSSSVEDLWEWDTAKLMDGNVYPWCNTIQNNGGLLEWAFTAAGSATTWVEYQPEMLCGARYQELLLYMTAGLSIRIVDGSDAIYTVSPKPSVNPASGLVLAGDLLTGTDVFFRLDGAFRDIERDDGGVITNPSDFSAFVTLPSEAVYNAKNPTGIRVLALGLVSLATSTNTPGSTLDILSGNPVKRTWIRPLSTTSLTPAHNTVSPGDMRLPMDLVTGRKYSLTLFVNFDAVPGANEIMKILNSLVGTVSTNVVTSYLGANDRSFFSDSDFYNIDQGIELLWQTAQTIDRVAGGTGDMNTVYGAGYFVSNWVRVEEVF